REENFKPSLIINKVVETTRPAAFNKSLELTVETSSTVPHIAKGFDILTHRILLNLVSNAIKFTDKGEVIISLDYQAEPSALIISVSDTGIGIEENQYEKIFELFQRLTPSYQNLYRGRGLGLYLVKQFTDHMHGTIKLKSTVGKGTTFTCTIPIIAATGEALNHAEEAYLTKGSQTDLEETSGKANKKEKAPTEGNRSNITAQTSTETNQINVLLVEDDITAQMVAESILKNLNCTITLAGDSKQTLKAVNEQTFDFIFMDIGLPDQDGVYTTEQIRQTENLNQATPIVALTAHATGEAKGHCLKAGMNSVMQKPLSKGKAQTVLKQFVLGDIASEVENTSANITSQPHAIIDLESMIEMMGKEQSIELFIKFGESLISDKADMEKAFANRDWSNMRKVLHRLKGALCYCKAPRLSAARTKFHAAVKASEDPEIEDLQLHYNKMMQELDTLAEEIYRRFGT
nr:response regulator [Gammaproteobacteria bacterium]